MDAAQAVLHDGSTIAVPMQGDGPAVLPPVSLAPHTAAEVDTLRQWGGDPDLGPNLISGLAPTNRVMAADYEAHRMANPAPRTLTSANIAVDLLAHRSRVRTGACWPSPGRHMPCP
ncbi:UNVERIFIED_ORG: hypothetical protein ABIB52_000358 [Arthrobacter sp. UYCu721]